MRSRLIDLREGERVPALLAFLELFFLMTCYSILRPVREALGIEGGTDKLPWLFTGTFLASLVAVPLYLQVVARFTRRRIVPIVHRFFVLNLLVFWWLLWRGAPGHVVGWVFYVWFSVFNVLVVAVFWGLMADLFRPEQGRRLFAFVAAGGSAGALLGPLLTSQLVAGLGAAHLLLIAAVLLEACTQCVSALLRRAGGPTRGASPEPDVRIGGGVLDGIGVVFRRPYLLGLGAQILCLTTTATFLYLLQARLVAEGYQGVDARTAVFANIDLGVNVLTILIQLFVTSPLLARAGLSFTMRLLPVVTLLGSLALAAAPGLLLLAVFQIVRRAVQYATYRPVREMLFLVVERREKYKSKAFIDTVVYRGGDVASAWAFDGLLALGLKAGGLALAGVPVALGWYAVSGWLSRRQQALAAAAQHSQSSPERGHAAWAPTTTPADPF